MWPVIYIAAILVVALIVLVLFAAFDLTLDIRVDKNGFSRKLKIRWMGISRTIKLEGKEKKPKKKKPKKKEEKEKKKWGREEISRNLRIFRDIRDPVLKLVSNLLHAIRIHTFSFDLTFGLPDPADTGMACGFLHPLLAFIKHRCRVCRYWIEPRFDDEILDLHLFATLRLRIYSLIPPVVRFVINRKVLKAGWKLLRK